MAIAGPARPMLTTATMRAQEEHERLRQLESDLAHMNRLSMMGELAASLAHEITQPSPPLHATTRGRRSISLISSHHTWARSGKRSAAMS